MSVSSLPADQIAVLELVLERGRSYDEIADLLGIDPHAVRARAHAAVDALGPNGSSGKRLTTARRGELADFLLGQQDDDAAEATRSHLAASSGSRAWARVVAGELKPLGGDKLPEIPTSDAKAAPAPPKKKSAPKKSVAPPVADDDEDDLEADDEGDDDDEGAATGRPSLGAARPSSRLGGALLIGGVVLVVVVGVVLIAKPFGGGGGDKKNDSAAVTKTKTTATTPAAAPQVIGQINLTGQGRAVGIAQIVKQANTRALVIAGQNLPTDKNTAFAVWLYNSPKSATRLGYAQPSTTAGRLQAIAPLPADSGKFQELVISGESRQAATTGKGPQTPTTILLRGKLDSATPVPAGTGTGTGTGAGAGAGTTTPTSP